MLTETWQEQYREVKRLRPDIYRRVTEIGSICHIEESADFLTIGAKVESAVMELVLQLLRKE